MAYNLGTDNGISHVFVDNTVMNGRTYYYGLVAYDYGAPNIGPGIAPSENNVVVELDEAEEVRSIGKNVAIVTPTKPAAGYLSPDITINESNLPGGGEIVPAILAQASIVPKNEYLVQFEVDTISQLPSYEHGILYTTSGISIYNSASSELVYSENPQKYVGSNLLYLDSLSAWTLNPDILVKSDVFDGVQLTIDQPFTEASYDYANSGWVQGNGIMRILPTPRESKFMPWDYDIIFTSDPSRYTTVATSKLNIRDETDTRIATNQILLGQNFNFYVKNNTIQKSDGTFEIMDMVVDDLNKNGQYDRYEDRIIVGGVSKDKKWGGTVFVIDFSLSSDATYPKTDDVFRVKFMRPFWKTDHLKFTINSYDELNTDSLKHKMKEIRVVPNPYVATNVMEPAVSNQFLNQRRRLLFTNIPAQATIKIFTVSGILVDEIAVNNLPQDGSVHWDMLTREGLEIAAGMYLYHVESLVTGDKKLGKFAVIK